MRSICNKSPYFKKELMELYNLASATFHKLSLQMLFPDTFALEEDFTRKFKLG